MTTAAVLYHSRSATTWQLGEEIGEHLRTRGVEAWVVSVADCEPEVVEGYDVVLLGCWTSGWLVVRQHPEEPWVRFARRLPDLSGKRVGLFTTYKIATGSMFSRMRRELAGKVGPIDVELRSRDGHLSDDGKRALDRLVGGA